MKNLDPKAVWLFFINFSIRGLILIIFFGFYLTTIFFQDSISGFIILALFFCLILVLAYVWARLTYSYYLYELTLDGFKKESGVISKRYVTIPYDRIQNVDIYRGIVERFLGLSNLLIQTAGSSAVVYRRGLFSSGVDAEGKLIGLSKEVAEQLRDELIKKAKSFRTPGM